MVDHVKGSLFYSLQIHSFKHMNVLSFDRAIREVFLEKCMYHIGKFSIKIRGPPSRHAEDKLLHTGDWPNFMSVNNKVQMCRMMNHLSSPAWLIIISAQTKKFRHRFSAKPAHRLSAYSVSTDSPI